MTLTIAPAFGTHLATRMSMMPRATVIHTRATVTMACPTLPSPGQKTEASTPEKSTYTDGIQ